MGQFLQTPEPAQKLARQYGVRGMFSPDLIPAIQPVTIIDNLVDGLDSVPQRICVSRGNQAGVSAELTHFRLDIPPRTIVEILQIQPIVITSNATLNISFGSTAGVIAPVTLFLGQITDGRLRSQGQVPASILGADTDATPIAPIIWALPCTPQGTIFQMPQEFPVVAGRTDGVNFDFIEFQLGTVNVGLGLSVMWRETSAQVVR